MKILGPIIVVEIGFLAWKVIRAITEFSSYDILIEEDEPVMREDDLRYRAKYVS